MKIKGMPLLGEMPLLGIYGILNKDVLFALKLYIMTYEMDLTHVLFIQNVCIL